MVAYSFRKLFVPKIEAKDKRQTIRAPRKRHVRPDEEIQLYFAMRTVHCRLIGRSTCLAVLPIFMAFDYDTPMESFVEIDRERPPDLDRFAQADGFDDFATMTGYWRKMHPDANPFEGFLIQWDPKW